MEAKIINIKEFKAVGITYFGNNSKGEIKELWEVFNKSCNNVKHKSKSQLYYGICDDMPDAEGRFHYTACTEVDSFEDIPAGMDAKVVPAGKYAVYTYSGAIDDLGEFYESIFSKWMPAAAYECDCRPQLELYDHRFMQNGEFDIYIPIK
ncbi:GyrI-like domain-containing protein [Desnuesiella massiliensis]|uniref:GyrI-like domain-containing protein n=1 Tax=Desnuesiella massiliensis TaxID=1650662 RepID=UPI0006E257B6|nr:GyrI-like domain-containing protein [Desnuesiella massiliensis]